MRWRNLIIICLIASPATLIAANQSEIQGQIEQVRKEREALVEEQKKLEADLATIGKETQNLGAAVKSLDATKKKLASDIKLTQSKIKSTDLNIKSLENTIGEKESQMSIHKRAIKETLMALSEHDKRPIILSILAAAELSEIWRDRSQFEGLSERLDAEVDSLRQTKLTLAQQKVQKEKVKEEQVSLQGQLSGQKSVVEENQKAKETLLVQTKNKEVEYQKILAQNLERQRQSEEDLFKLESELKFSLDPSLIPSEKNGVLTWPLDKIRVTNKFGTNDGNKRIYANGFHNGVDFGASMGTPVKSMHEGVVRGTGNTDEQKGCYSYGRWILIDYGNGLTSIYGHLSSLIVKKGDSVKAGQVIGHSGGTPGVNGSGYSTGPHLHVGLFATQAVQIQQFSTSRACKLVSVPIAQGTAAYLDPLAYLPPL